MSKVHQSIVAVQHGLAQQGIAKAQRNQQQGFNYRGIDDVQNAMAPLLAKHGLTILPEVLSRECTERQTSRGGTLYNVVLHVRYHLTSAEDGSTTTAVTFGEAMDSADKATNKALSAAYKYLVLQTFCVPLEGQHDADADTPEDTAPTACSAAQAQEIAGLVAQTGIDMTAFLGYYKSKGMIGEGGTIADLTDKGATHAIATLKKRAAA